jgi:hypothetical protein
MPSCEVQRTLVKSPPELWAELSDPTSLAKHLGEFGEIRIAHIEPETAVEWEAEEVRGVVQLKASGWGTKVTLTAVRDGAQETAAAELSPDELATAEASKPVASPDDPESQNDVAQADIEAENPQPAVEPEPELSAVAEATPFAEHPPADSTPVVDATPIGEHILVTETDLEPPAEFAPEPERRPSLFARLFRRRRKAGPAPEADAGECAETSRAGEESVPEEENLPHANEPEPSVLETLEPQPSALEAPVPQPSALEGPEPQPDAVEELEPGALEELEPEAAPTDLPALAAELAQIEQAMVEQDTALLKAVLDRLGAAHHRPFSRG